MWERLYESTKQRELHLQNELSFEPSILVKTLSSALATLAHFANRKEQVNESGGGLRLRH